MLYQSQLAVRTWMDDTEHSKTQLRRLELMNAGKAGKHHLEQPSQKTLYAASAKFDTILRYSTETGTPMAA